MNWQEWFEANKKYIYGADVDAWCEIAWDAAIASVAAPEQSEPVGKVLYDEHQIKYIKWNGAHWTQVLNAGDKLYTAAPQPTELSESDIRAEFGKLYPNDLGILALAENNRDYALEAIGARHHWAAFLAGARAVLAAQKGKAK